MRNILSILSALFFVSSCESYDFPGMIVASSPSVETRFEESAAYNSTHKVQEITVSSDEYSIMALTDIHSCNDKASLCTIGNFVSRCVDGLYDVEPVVLCLGDIVNGRNLFDEIYSVLEPFYAADSGDGSPVWHFFTSIGNHDTYFGEWENYRKYWPSTVYYFTIVTPSARDLFICLDSSNATLGRKQRVWLEDLLASAAKEGYRNITLFTHTHFFKKDNSQGKTGNCIFEETADLLSLFAQYGVDYVLSGHDHFYEKTIFRGVEYYVLNAFLAQEEEGSAYRLTFGDRLTLEEKRRSVDWQ